MKPLRTLTMLIALVLMTTGAAHATSILDISDAIDPTDPTQLGRLSRNGIPQDWAGSEPFPGIFNPTTLYRYTTYSVNVGLTPYIQVIFDSVSVNTFVSAYDTSYVSTTLNANWLGDAGGSGNPFGVDPLFFQVLVPLNHNLIIVVNTTTNTTTGVGDPFRLMVEGFIDAEFTDPPATPAAVPEPATLLLSGGGLTALLLKRRARLAQVRARAPQPSAGSR